MKSINVKWPIIILCTFVFLLVISMIYVTKKYENNNHVVPIITYNEDRQLGDSVAYCSSYRYSQIKSEYYSNSNCVTTKVQATSSSPQTVVECKTTGANASGHYGKKITYAKKCEGCVEGYYLFNGGCQKRNVSILGNTTIGIAQDVSTVSSQYSLKDDNGNVINATWSILGTGASISDCTNTSSCVITFNHGGVTCKNNSPVTIKASANGNEATIKVNVYSFAKWSKQSGNWSFSANQPNREAGKLNSSCDAYEDGSQSGSRWVYKTYYNRCCSSGSSSSTTPPTSPTEPEKCYIYNQGTTIKFKTSSGNPGLDWKEYNGIECGACFGDTDEFKNAKNVIWSNDGNDSNHQNMYANISHSNCSLPLATPDICKDSSLKDKNKSVSAQTCEENTPLNIKQTICSDNTSSMSYYNVEINRTYSSQVDYKEYSSKPGVGFKYNVLLEETKDIKATFDYEKWEKHYADYYNSRSKYGNSSPWYWYYDSILTSLENVLKYYNNHYVNWGADEINTDLVLYVAYKFNNKDYSMTFSDFVIDSEQSSYSELTNSSKERKVNGVNVKYNISKTITSKIMMIPKKSILNKQLSTISYENRLPDSSLSEIDGGNKVYIISTDSNGNKSIVHPDNGEYSLSLTVSMDGNTITNDKCPLYVQSTDLQYRIINVSNPFINDDYEKGINWYNIYNDYTGVIKSDTWSLPSKYVFDLNNENIIAIKKNNNLNDDRNKYLGTCYLPSSLIGNDIKSIICDRMK